MIANNNINSNIWTNKCNLSNNIKIFPICNASEQKNQRTNLRNNKINSSSLQPQAIKLLSLPMRVEFKQQHKTITSLETTCIVHVTPTSWFSHINAQYIINNMHQSIMRNNILSIYEKQYKSWLIHMSVFWLDLGWPRFDLYCAPTKPSMTGPFGNDLQADHSCYRSIWAHHSQHSYQYY